MIRLINTGTYEAEIYTAELIESPVSSKPIFKVCYQIDRGPQGGNRCFEYFQLFGSRWKINALLEKLELKELTNDNIVEYIEDVLKLIPGRRVEIVVTQLSYEGMYYNRVNWRRPL